VQAGVTRYPDGAGDAVWSEYVGDTIYGDFTVEPSTDGVTMARTYLSPWAHMEAGGFEPVYYHADHLGTTRLLSQQDQGGFNVLSHVYTGFGEADTLPENPPVDAATRYGYVGAHGYETGLLTFAGGEDTFPITLQHVGERWYDPALGRFLQRDPIGIRAGVNTYAYVRSQPVLGTDPSGLQYPDMPGSDTNPYYPEPWPRPEPEPKPPPMRPGQELELVKVEIWGLNIGASCVGAGVGASLGGPIGAVIGFMCPLVPAIIDQVSHWGEPLNPAYGGDYDKYYE
jgi:RHS repeat-associated protein